MQDSGFEDQLGLQYLLTDSLVQNSQSSSYFYTSNLNTFHQSMVLLDCIVWYTKTGQVIKDPI